MCLSPFVFSQGSIHLNRCQTSCVSRQHTQLETLHAVSRFTAGTTRSAQSQFLYIPRLFMQILHAVSPHFTSPYLPNTHRRRRRPRNVACPFLLNIGIPLVLVYARRPRKSFKRWYYVDKQHPTWGSLIVRARVCASLSLSLLPHVPRSVSKSTRIHNIALPHEAEKASLAC